MLSGGGGGAVAWSLDGELLAAGSQNSQLTVFKRLRQDSSEDAESDGPWREAAQETTSGGVLDLAFNDAASVLVAGTLPGPVLVS